MTRTFLFFLYLILSVCLSAQINDDLQIPEDSLIEIPSSASKSFFEKEGVRMSIAPVLLFTASAASWGEREHIREVRNRYIPSFNMVYDDYLQYAPAATVYGLNLGGVKGRNNIKRATFSYAASLGIMAIVVNSIKYTAKVERPDGSTKNSFPSGHTANAFTNASFLHKEYGVVNPLYSIGGYSMATFTGLGRNLNNRHWISDVLAGAGIGILSTELGYFFMDKIYGNKGDNLGMFSKIEGNDNPSFLALKVGSALATTNFLRESELDDSKETGFEFGLEGAYFFTKNWGVGGNVSFSSFPISPIHFDFDDPSWSGFDIVTQSLGFFNMDIGPYFAHYFSENWLMMLKTTVGFSTPANGKVLVKSEYIDLPNNEYEVASYQPSKSFRWTNGASATYKLNSNLGLTAYVDYHLSNSDIFYRFAEELKNDEEIGEFFNDDSVKEKINYFTLGLKLTAFF